MGPTWGYRGWPGSTWGGTEVTTRRTNVGTLVTTSGVLRELELKHQALIVSLLEKELKSVRVMNELRRLPQQ